MWHNDYLRHIDTDVEKIFLVINYIHYELEYWGKFHMDIYVTHTVIKWNYELYSLFAK